MALDSVTATVEFEVFGVDNKLIWQVQLRILSCFRLLKILEIIIIIQNLLTEDKG